MLKFSSTVLKIFCIVCLSALTFGCEKEAPPPPTPKVVRQKISTPESKAPEVQKKKAAPAVAKAAPAPAPAKATPPAAEKVAPQAEGKKEDKSAPAPAGTIAAEKKTVKPAETAPVPAPIPPAKQPEPKIEAPAADSPAAETEQKAPPAITLSDFTKLAQPKKLVDPFEPLFREVEKPAAVAKVETKKKRRVPMTPIEKIDLSQLKLTAVIRLPSGNKAMVEEASGKGYIIKEGTYIGIHSGRVTKILNDTVIVEEEVENALGKVTTRKRELKLQKPLGE